MNLKNKFGRKFQIKKESYDLEPINPDGSVSQEPTITKDTKLITKKNGYRCYAPGSGCINWGEGLPLPIDKNAVKEVKKSKKTITKKSEPWSDDD